MSPLHPRRAVVLFLLSAQVVFLALSMAVYRTRPQGLIASDGKSYYAWLRSLALDHDLDFTNDFALIYAPGPVPVAPIRPDGLVANKTSIGVALVETPGFMVGHAAAAVLGMPRDGVSAPYQFAVALSLQLFCLFGLWLLWLGMVRLGADPLVAAIGVAGALLATNLIQYVARPAMAHGPGVAVLCSAFYLAATMSNVRVWRSGAIGALLGLAFIIRTSNGMLAPLFVVLLWPHLGRSVKHWLTLVAGFAVPLALQVGLASAQWDRLMFSSYGDEGFTAGITGIIGSLFTAKHGLFVYHPWYLFAVLLAALASARRQTRALGIAALLCFGAFVVMNGTWWSWWFGDGFGNRSFVETVPVLLVPAVLWLSLRLKETGQSVVRYVAAATLVLMFANMVLWSGFILRRYPPDGDHTIAQAYLWWR